MRPQIAYLNEIERCVSWLAAWTIHHSKHIREADEVKVGGHQAYSASLSTIMTALYYSVLRPQDRVAVETHASPIFHAIQYLTGQSDPRNAGKLPWVQRRPKLSVAHQGRR